jgi:DNA-binding NarL/FixJ family response regulator
MLRFLPASLLAPAQHKVLELMTEGLHDVAIARRAGVSTTTVRRHISAIMARLNGEPHGLRGR